MKAVPSGNCKRLMLTTPPNKQEQIPDPEFPHGDFRNHSVVESGGRAPQTSSMLFMGSSIVPCFVYRVWWI